MKSQINTELFRALAEIAEDSIAMEKVVKYVKKLAAQKSDETLVSKEEFFASLARGEEDYRQGKCIRLQAGESVRDMLRRAGY